jgi:hypothetical protein
MSAGMPRLLFINDRKPDYLQDLTYSGLVGILGAGNVTDRPWNPYYHLQQRAYPRNLGYVKNSLFRSLLSGIPINRYDAVLIGAAKPACFAEYLAIARRIPASTPIIFIDGGDWPEIGGDLHRLKAASLYERAIAVRPFDLVAKREYLMQSTHPENVVPLPFSCNFDYYADPPRPSKFKYDVSFWAVESHPIRSAAFDALDGHFDCRENGTVRNQVFRKHQRRGRRYLEELKSCRIVLNFRGVGWDTLRYWEAPGLGRCMISQRPNIRIPDNFREGKEIVYCKDTLSDMIELCSYYLAHEEERETIARNARAFARERHSNTARARYLLAIMTSILHVSFNVKTGGEFNGSLTAARP